MSEIRKLPQQDERVESGVVQFGDDWPGVFIRGDHAFYYAQTLERVEQHAEAANDPFTALAALGLRTLLESSRVKPQ